MQGTLKETCIMTFKEKMLNCLMFTVKTTSLTSILVSSRLGLLLALETTKINFDFEWYFHMPNFLYITPLLIKCQWRSYRVCRVCTGIPCATYMYSICICIFVSKLNRTTRLRLLCDVDGLSGPRGDAGTRPHHMTAF
jgi:hypothetical protein